MVRGNLEAALALTGANVTSVGSPGGICTLLTSELPPRVVSLWGRHSSRSGPVEQRRAAMCAQEWMPMLGALGPASRVAHKGGRLQMM
jgi:hypothetical protein